MAYDSPEASPSPRLTPEQLAIRVLARDFTRVEVAPLADRLDPIKGDIPRDLIHKMGDLGFFAILIPEELGGLGLGVMVKARIVQAVREARGAACSSPERVLRPCCRSAPPCPPCRTPPRYPRLT